jgi:hypothetical protein
MEKPNSDLLYPVVFTDKSIRFILMFKIFAEKDWLKMKKNTT